MIEIDGRKIGPGYSPYTIAEISCNHSGSIDNAIKLIKIAKSAGASAVKTQCYTADTITLNVKKPDFIIQDGLWKGRSLWELYNKAHTPFEWHPRLYKMAKDCEITIFSSVFDHSAVDYLESLDCPAYKIASMEIVDIPLIEHVERTKKPMIISTGMASNQEILEAHEASKGRAAFLHCMSEYPGTIETSNLGGIHNLKKLLPNNVVGISDHSEGSMIPIAAVALGASIIEKHLGLLPGVKSEDDEFSLSGPQFGRMVADMKQIYSAMQYSPQDGNPSRQFRRSLYAVANIAKGDVFTKDNIRSVRPGYGLPCKLYSSLLGRKAGQSYRHGDPLR
jgi:N-acetylneuraminate synthase